MMNVVRLLCAFIRIIIKLSSPDVVKALFSENIAMRQQLMMLTRQRKRSPRLRASDKVLFGLIVSCVSLKTLSKLAILVKPTTILNFHQALVKRKYNRLFSNKAPNKPGRKGPAEEIFHLIIEMKKRNPRYGYLSIAMQIEHAFGITLDKGIVKRALDKHYKPTTLHGDGTSWLTFIGHMKDSL